MPDYREFTMEQERQTLQPYATLSADSRGRQHPISPCHVRTEFQRDRDRILHCKSFRRLKHKTQVFLAPRGDHYRTRLTHTLEVAQIARTIARALRLNEDLTEAIALGHDLGHTPFGHAGESVLNNLIPGGFEHNVQSLRLVEKLENGVGLNLTYEVRDGILNHKKNLKPCTLEGMVVNWSDRIAYINHDIDDAIRAGVLCPQDLPKSSLELLGDSHGARINNMIVDVVQESFGKPQVTMSRQVGEEFERLRKFMFDNVYFNPKAKGEEGKAMALVEALFRYYLEHLQELPEDFRNRVDEDGEKRVVGDYIACMTDHYAIETYKTLFVPLQWA